MSDRIRDLSLRHPVVAGVDGSRNNQAAVRYAVVEAAETGRPLQLVAVLDAPSHSVAPSISSDPDWMLLTNIGRRATRQHPGLTVRSTLEFGNVSCRLLERSRRADRLVIGRRGLGSFGQRLLGSTSSTLAAESDRPVVVVPADWHPTGHSDRPIVVGADVEDPDDTAIIFGFQEAQRRRVALVVVHAIDPEPRLVWDPFLSGPTYRSTLTVGTRHLEETVDPLRSRFPSVPVTLCDERVDPATALLRRSRAAQLLVLGRGDRGLFGRVLDSTSRAVLHYAEVPVAVIP